MHPACPLPYEQWLDLYEDDVVQAAHDSGADLARGFDIDDYLEAAYEGYLCVFRHT